MCVMRYHLVKYSESQGIQGCYMDWNSGSVCYCLWDFVAAKYVLSLFSHLENGLLEKNEYASYFS